MHNENILIDLVEKSQAMFKNLRRKGIISEKELKCFSFEYKKATNLGKPYLLPKIHKVFLGKGVLKIPMTKVHKHDPTKFPNIYFSKKKAQHNFCSFRFKVSIHKVFHQQFIFKTV